MKLLKRIFSVFDAREQLKLAGILLFIVVGALLEAIGVSAIMPVVAMLANEEFLNKYQWVKSFFSYLGMNSQKEILSLSVVSLMSFFVLKSGYMFWLTQMQVKFTAVKQSYYAGALFRLYLDKPYLYHVEKNSAEFIRNINNNIPNFFSGMLNSAFMVLTELLVIISIYIALMLIDPLIAIIIFGVLGSVIYLLITAVRAQLKELGTSLQTASIEVNKNLLQGLGGVKETKVMCKEKYFSDLFEQSFKMHTNIQSKYAILGQLPRLIIENVVMVGLLLVVLCQVLIGYNMEQIIPIFGAVAVAAFRVMPSANRLAGQINGLRYMEPLLDTIYDELVYIRKHPEIQEAFKEKPRKLIFRKNIVVENISFRYSRGSELVLENVSFKISQGSFVGIVGASGAGKTTLVDIILGLLEPQQGNVYVDNKDIYDNIRGWQALLAYVPQNIYLVDGTIRENIALGEPEQCIDNTRVWEVVKKAELYAFVCAHKDGINAKVGEHGVKLSGGQRQRIGIARALYRNPQVLIVDEATSALDNETEKHIMDTVLKLKGGITIIAITHRLTTLASCDFKIKLADGKVEMLI